jgi:hypothetical protein
VADVNGIVERLLLFLESGYDHIVAETLVQLKDLLRRYPDLGEVRIMSSEQSNVLYMCHGETRQAQLTDLLRRYPDLGEVSTCAMSLCYIVTWYMVWHERHGLPFSTAEGPAAQIPRPRGGEHMSYEQLNMLKHVLWIDTAAPGHGMLHVS